MSSLKQLIKIPLGLLIALVAMPQISETIYTPALPSVASSLGASAHWVEATLSIYFLGFAAGVLLWGAVSDYWGRRPTMLVGLVLYALGTFFCGTSMDVAQLLTWRFVQAFGASVGSIITQTMLRDAYSGEERSRIFSVISGALAFSPAIGPLLGGLLSAQFAWRANFAFLLVLAAVLTVWSLRALPETRPENLESPKAGQVVALLKAMLSSTPLWGHVLLIGGTNGILFSFYEEAPFLFIDQLGMAPGAYGLFGLLVAGATLLAARISFRLAGKLAPETMIFQGACITTVGGGSFLLLVTCGLLSLEAWGLALTSLCLFVTFLGVGMIIRNSLSLALKPFQAMVGTAGSIFGALYYILVAALTFIMSILHDGTALPLPLFLASLGAVLLLAGLMVQPETRLEEVG